MTATTVTRLPKALVLTRHLAAPREQVFRALSRAEHLRRWWGPPSCPVVECTVDFRPGGIWHYRLRSSDGREHWMRAVYRDIVPPERISWVEHSSDEHGAVTTALAATFATLTLATAGGSTLLTAELRYDSTSDRDAAIARGVERGFSAALDELHTLLGPTPATDTTTAVRDGSPSQGGIDVPDHLR
ncbi:SRPBCC domain-containing protein [Tersicoccus sp. MR15.9]|uniref:SRPBCC domain-containing protein n=1 Tax=Tersicoccus mangrovi TaxID=3121635 RepID=UPI002FE519D9